MIHDFKKSLELSHFAAGLPIWDDIYRRAFPGFLSSHDHREDGEHQRAGIDKSIILANSQQILIDEKSRWRAFDDIALEYLSDRDRGIWGWVCKPLRAHFITYAVHPLGKAYLLPVLPLQAAWRKNSTRWIEAYKKIEAKNKGWVTISCAVPVKMLFAEIGAALRYDYEPITEDEALDQIRTGMMVKSATPGPSPAPPRPRPSSPVGDTPLLDWSL